jgi:L-malate glycosyltransferase
MGYKVLFITFWYPIPDNKVNGIFIKEHAKAIHSEGHELAILHFDFAYSEKLFSLKKQVSYEENTGKIYRITLRSRYWKWFYHFLPFLDHLSKKAYKELKEKGFTPQIIHANVVFPSGIAGSYLAKRHNLPAVLSEHWSGFEGFCNHPVFGKVTRKAVSSFRTIMPVSAHLGSIIQKYINPSQSIVTIPNIVDSSIYKRKTDSKTGASLNFVMVANWQIRKVPAKRPDIIIEALQLFVKQSKKKVTLHVVGEGNGLDNIKAEHLKYDFECVFHGFLEKKEISELLSQSDLFLHASNFETFSIVTVEALLTGTPVIVSDIPALREFVNEENGILVTNDPTLWTIAIRDAVDKKWDTDKIAATIAGKYTFTKVGAAITSVYNQVSGSKS